MNLQEAKDYLAEIRYLEAYWKGKTFFKPTMLVAHSMEAGEFSTTAENCAGYMARSPGQGGPSSPASINYSTDNNSTVCSLVPGREAYHSGVGVINRCSIGTEHAGFADQSREEWLDDYSYAMLWGQSAKLQAALAIVNDIQIRYLDVDALRRGERNGVTDHWTITRAFNVSGGHTDPGSNFPMQSWLQAIRDHITPPVVTVNRRNMKMFDQKLNPKNGLIIQVRVVNPRVIEFNQQTAPNAVFDGWRPIGTGPNVPAPTPGAFDSVTVDFNQDGRMEIVAWHSYFNVPYRYTQDASGWFREPQRMW
jgi:hypothetical protein